MLKSESGARRFANMSAPAPNAAKGSTTSTATTKRSIPARLPHRPIAPSASSSLQKRTTTSSSSVTSLTSRRGKATTTTSSMTAARSAAAPALSHDASRKGLEAYLPRSQAAAHRACPAVLSEAPHPLPEGSVPPRYLLSSSVKASLAAGAAETGARAACSRNNHLSSPVRGGAALGSSQRANSSVETSAEEKGNDERQEDRSPMYPLAGLPQRTQELCEELITLDSLVEADEAFFSAQADMESHVMELLRLWREAALAGDSLGGSRRPSGVYALATTSTPSAAGMQPGDAVASSSGGGTQRVLQDFKEARERIALLAELHEELTELEEQHRGLQRRYVVEMSPLSALDELCARLDEEDEEALEDGTDACTMEGAEQAVVGTHRDDRSKLRQWQGRSAMRAGRAACRLLADRLRSRCMRIGDRLTDELLWVRSEMARHEWTALQASTPLTQMDRVVPLDAREDCPVTGASAIHPTSLLFPPPLPVTAAGRCVKDSANFAANSNANRFSEGAGSTRDGDGNESDRSKATGTSMEARESFVLRVHVPVFASATPPALGTTLPAGLATGSEAATDATASYASRASGDCLHSMSSVERMRRRPSGGAQAISSAPTTTVSVIATPTRYALVQLYECCREGLAAMLTRLCALRARRCKEVEQLQQEQSAMDVYDPAADDLAERCAALLRYVNQLDEWSGEVLQMDQVLHERVKLPLDAALQTYERLRTQLLEVLRQRLEDEEERDNERAAAGVDAEEDGGEVNDGDERRRPREAVSDDGSEELRAWQALGGEGNGGDHPQRMSGSVDNDRVHGGTQSPAKASSGAAPPTILPRASAEFLVMLEELLQEQQAACKHLPAASSGFAGDTSCGERELDTGEYRRKEDEPSGEASVLEQGPSAAEGHNEGISALDDAKAASEAEHLRIPPAAYSCTTTATVTTGKANASQAADANADGSSVGVDAGHLAGRRRQRDDVEDKAGGAPSHSAVPDTAEERHAHFSDLTAVEALPREITVHVSSSSCSELGEELVERAGAEQCVAHTEGEARGLPHMPGHERDDSAADDGDSDSDSNGGSRGSGESGDSGRRHQRQRYAVGSGNGLGEGLRAFFSAVVRRAMRFDDSDDDADEAMRATAFRGRQQGSTSLPPSHKRARRE
ncbi:hypothetical protein LSCM4_07640 [Leishmania orientalis]|uniref:Uncharacterized protein n=1 Tax=Leishmania orientalis TaxID=2249476 RepID=A0A836L0U3_9TRYP|nr:hypothetical protein LSCM4_07640 [Leishmania orientalis]